MKKNVSWLKGLKGNLIMAATIPFLGLLVLGYLSTRAISEVHQVASKFQTEVLPQIADKNIQLQFREEILNVLKSQQEGEFLILLTTAVFALVTLALAFLTSAKVGRSMSSIVEKLDTTSASVNTSVEQLTNSGKRLSHSAAQSAASLEQTAASLEEMSSMVQLNSDNAKQAAALSASSRESAEKGQHEIESLIASMQEISKSSKKIEEIITVIDDIAFQTNLLALNASVEAARAGEQGKGFAVVAEAVRALAQRSANAAKDITQLIKSSVMQVDQGGKMATQSGAVLNNIVTSVKKVADLNNEIASASAEQSTGIQQIGKAMNQLDQLSQANAAAAEEVASTSSEISEMASFSRKLTLELGETLRGSASQPPPPSAPPKETKKAKVHLIAKNPSKTIKASVAPPAPTPTPAPAMAAVQSTPKPAKPKKSQAQDLIPFDEDLSSDPRAKIGTIDGF